MENDAPVVGPDAPTANAWLSRDQRERLFAAYSKMLNQDFTRDWSRPTSSLCVI